MSEASETVTVTIMERTYQVACPAGERTALEASARQLDSRMKEIRNSGKVFGVDRIAVMAALNIAHEMLKERGARELHDSKVIALHDKIDALIAENTELEF